MSGQEGKRLLELQMEELRESYGITKEELEAQKKNEVNHRTENKAKIAKLYEDAGEYEEELEYFEGELKVLQSTELKDLVAVLNKTFPNAEGNYAEDIKGVLIAHWTQFVEVDKTHPLEQLELIKITDFSDVVDELNAKFPEYSGDFELEIKSILLKRWEMLVSIKKEHVAEERAEMKLRGMKPDHIRKVYRLYHGLDV